jgi:hypothetical protein
MSTVYIYTSFCLLEKLKEPTAQYQQQQQQPVHPRHPLHQAQRLAVVVVVVESLLGLGFLHGCLPS